MKRMYHEPTLVEYGRLAEITLGTGSVKPDLFNGINTNTNCNDTSSDTTSCNVTKS